MRWLIAALVVLVAIIALAWLFCRIAALPDEFDPQRLRHLDDAE